MVNWSPVLEGASGGEPPARSCARRPRARFGGVQGGFSLLEVLVAFTVLALCLGLLIQVFSRATNTTVLSGDYSRAAALAEAQLNAVGIDIPLEPGSYGGEPEDDLSWQVLIEPFVPGNVDWEPALETLIVTSVVSWHDGGEKRRQVRLTSLRFADATDPPGLASERRPDLRRPRSDSSDP